MLLCHLCVCRFFHLITKEIEDSCAFGMPQSRCGRHNRSPTASPFSGAARYRPLSSPAVSALHLFHKIHLSKAPFSSSLDEWHSRGTPELKSTGDPQKKNLEEKKMRNSKNLKFLCSFTLRSFYNSRIVVRFHTINWDSPESGNQRARNPSNLKEHCTWTGDEKRVSVEALHKTGIWANLEWRDGGDVAADCPL